MPFKSSWLRIKKRIFFPLIVFIVKRLLRLLVFSCRFETTGIDAFKQFASANPCILMLWHNRLVIFPELLNKYAPEFLYRAVISQSRDAELLAILANSYKQGRTLRVPHNARFQALNEMIFHLKNSKEIMVMTPDGPRGPRYKVKPGIVIAARAASVSIIPVSWQADKMWQLNTWDKLMIPKPFSRITFSFGPPIRVEENREEARLKLQTALNEVV